ncbi:hypothetical protein THF1C08_260052 [Vibrio jasicida]|nr:hypothetical protein THF1C08_260052 [Vibrio jasicida]
MCREIGENYTVRTIECNYIASKTYSFVYNPTTFTQNSIKLIN